MAEKDKALLSGDFFLRANSCFENIEFAVH